MTDAFRAADLQADRVALTTRLLRLQGALPPVGATFAVNATGQLLAASSPFPAAMHRLPTPTGSVAPSPTMRCRWRCSAPIPGCVRPVGGADRVVRDASGKIAGLVGAVLRVEDLARLIGRTWLGPGVSVEFHGVDGVLDLPSHEAAPPAAG